MSSGPALNGDKPEPFTHHSASLRIFGEIEDLDAISRELGLVAAHTHRKGDRRSTTSPPYEHDMWLYEAEVGEDHSLTDHLDVLWKAIEPSIAYLKSLKPRLKVDVFCGYRSNQAAGGFEVDHRALVIFTELEVPFEVSVIV